MSYRKNFFEHTQATLARIAEADKKIEELKAERGMYSYAFFDGKMKELEDQRDALIRENRKAALQIVDSIKARNHDAFRMKPEELTDDERLLQSGINFTAEELEEMLDRYNGNRTMERIVMDHAAGKKMLLNRSPMTENGANEIADTMMNYFNSAVSRPQYPEWKDQAYFDGFTANLGDV